MAAPSLEDIAKAYCGKHSLRFQQRVGEGSFKETFEVVDSSRVPIALKIYKPAASAGRNARELEAMRKCSHPNIARLLAVEQYRQDSSTFVIIWEEFLPGGTLTSRGKLSADDAFSVGTQLIAAVAHTASIGLVHRDIKPDNILFRADGTTPVIVDFGTVRVLGDSSLTPTWVPRGPGTPFYSSPEQLNNEKDLTDWRSDQFSLGVVLAEGLTGEHPYQFPGFTPQQVVDAVANRAALNPDFILRATQIGFPALVKMIERWPVQRFRTTELLKQAWAAQRTKVP